MLEISEKSKNLPLSPIRKLVPLAEQALSRGVKILTQTLVFADIETPQIG